jgi:hypothetical protein
MILLQCGTERDLKVVSDHVIQALFAIELLTNKSLQPNVS